MSIVNYIQIGHFRVHPRCLAGYAPVYGSGSGSHHLIIYLVGGQCVQVVAADADDLITMTNSINDAVNKDPS
jgi:hypothetical protein